MEGRRTDRQSNRQTDRQIGRKEGRGADVPALVSPNSSNIPAKRGPLRLRLNSKIPNTQFKIKFTADREEGSNCSAEKDSEEISESDIKSRSTVLPALMYGCSSS